MEIQHGLSLKKYNTFGIDAKARHFVEVNTVAELKEVLRLTHYPEKFIISGGSNMLLSKDIEALVIHINIKGIQVVHEDGDKVVLKVMAGENWHEFVLWTLANDYGGLENLSLIPGNTGTAPIQNIGAYGVELKDTFVGCEALDIRDGTLIHFSKADCKFGYRDSYFKNEGKGSYIIVSITLRLTKKNHVLHTSYGAIEDELSKKNIEKPTIRDISNAVIAIRQRKLPDPNVLGNSGSFFKNPIIGKSQFQEFIRSYPNAPYYQLSEKQFKIPAGWLIEQCGFKGQRHGDAGVHEHQALVLVNHGEATGTDILELAHKIMDSVKSKFSIGIEPEVNIIK